MRKASANGAAIAHRAIGDAAGNLAKQAARRVGNASVLDIGVGDAGAEVEVIWPVGDRRQFGYRRDVDQEVGLGKAQIQHRPQRLAARQGLRKDLRLAEQRGGVG